MTSQWKKSALVCTLNKYLSIENIRSSKIKDKYIILCPALEYFN